MAAPQMKDVRTTLPRSARNATKHLRRRALASITHIGVHWNGPPVDADAWAQLVVDAGYHIRKDWDLGSSIARGWGLMYHMAVDQAGTIYWCNDFEDVLWHISGGNYKALGILCVLGQGQKPTQAMLDSLQRLLDWLTEERADIPAARANVWGHGECGGMYGGGPAWGNATECPGPDLLAFVRKYRAGIPITPTPVPQPQPTPPSPRPVSAPDPDAYIERNGYWLGGAIRRYYEANGGVDVFGLPLENEQQGVVLEDGREYTTQLFEYEMLAWRPGEQVRKVRLGAMYQQLREAA